MTADKDTIVKLESRFWQSMLDKDADTAATMLADESLVIGPQGIKRITPQVFKDMTRDDKWRLDSFKLSKVEVVFPAEDVAVIAYEVQEKGEMGGKPMDLECADSSTWIRDGDAWKCSLHTETILETKGAGA